MTRSTEPTPAGRPGLVSLALSAALLGTLVLPLGAGRALGESPPDHLVVSEIVTGGASASDELIELYNPTAAPLSLDGLELVYVSASGLTVSRRATWDAGGPEVPPGHHVLIANELGVYATMADAVYAAGMAATGGSVALRPIGAASAIDAVGWGSAASTWLEGTPAPAPAAGASLERLPGGAAGSTQDTDHNAADFVERPTPDPQSSASPPTPGPSDPSPSAPVSPSPSSSPVPTAIPSLPPTPSPTPDPVVSVAAARGMPDGTTVTVDAIALTGSAFAEGGGYVADATGGIAVILGSGSFERGALLRISGTVDDRFAQRTLRADASGVAVLGPGLEPDPLRRSTGSVSEEMEGRLVRVLGAVAGSPTTLSAGLAYDLDDGSGAVRVVVGSTTGIDTEPWTRGTTVELVGVVGQRDSSGTGLAGYRLQPRDADDVIAVVGPSPSPTASGSPPPGDADPSASPPPDDLASIAAARSLPKNSRVRVRGTVTMGPGVVDPVSAVIQDGTAAILLRVGDEVGSLARGDRVEVTGTRSTLGGMETLRVVAPAVHLGSGFEPAPVGVRTGDAGEALEARLVRVSGTIVATARRVASGTVSFEIDDGSGPLRVYLAAALGAESHGLIGGARVEAVGVLGQETTGAQPLRGYRVWPRSAGEVRILDPAGVADGRASGAADPGSAAGEAGAAAGAASSLADVGAHDLASLHVGATLVHGPWAQLGVAGLLWDGDRLVAIEAASEQQILGLLADRRPPVAVELTGLAARGVEPDSGIPLVALGSRPGDAALRQGPAHPPSGELPAAGARWVSLVGRLAGEGEHVRLETAGTAITVVVRCDESAATPAGVVRVTGIGVAEPSRILVPCGGVRAAPSFGDGSHGPGAGRMVASLPLAERATSPALAGDRRVLVAGLLAAGALLAATAAVVVRRLGLDPNPPGGLADEAAPAPAEPAPTADQPTLTLVGVPRERGSP